MFFDPSLAFVPGKIFLQYSMSCSEWGLDETPHQYIDLERVGEQCERSGIDLPKVGKPNERVVKYYF